MPSKPCYSFVLDPVCPGCHVRMNVPGAVRYAFVAADSMFVSDDGIMRLNDETDLILTNPEPVFNCAACGAGLRYEAVAER
jgi:hypothetical protein